MPRRKEMFYKGGIFHIFNKTLDKISAFSSPNKVSLFKNLLKYYSSDEIKIRYSEFRKIKKFRSDDFPPTNSTLYSCFAYAFMPNHFHLLLRQDTNHNLNIMLRKILISFTRIYNTLVERQGPLFLPQFRVVEIYNEQQMIHVSRYIHLNPYTSGLIKNLDELLTCPLISLPEYLYPNNTVCNTNYLLSFFNDNFEKYQKFIYDQADYQRQLGIIKKSVLS